MKHEKLSDALDQIRDSYIEDAAREKKKQFPWLGAVAAVLALAIVGGIGLKALPSAAETASDRAPEYMENAQSAHGAVADTAEPSAQFLLAAPEYPTLTPYPELTDLTSYNTWWEEQRTLHTQPDGYADNLEAYFGALIPQLLADSEGNTVCSPLNIYMALAMLAETTDGESRQQILDLLQADSMESLRTQAGQVWKAHYNNDGLSTSILGTSLWLHEDVAYNEKTVADLAEYYYASVFRGKLGSPEINEALQSWLNEQTGGLLEEQAEKVQLSPTSVLALATTVLYQVQWQDEFQAEFNTEAVFHSPSGDGTYTFMNRQLSYGPYFWSENFGAVYLLLEDGSRMWLLLPDEGIAPQDILEEAGAFFAQNPGLYNEDFENKKSIIVNLSLPKFDVAGDMDLVEKLKALGVTDIFDPTAADFSPILPQPDGGYVDEVTHAARVSIDEKGVTAAAFTVIDRCGSAMPPEEEIGFVLNRPFLFYIESDDGLPLFTGIVTQP